MSLQKCVTTTVAALCAALFAGALFASAQEFEVIEEPPAVLDVVAEEVEEVDAREAALSLLEEVQFALGVAAATGADPASAAAAQHLLNLLEGENGPNYAPVEGVEGDTYGAISYLEALAGRTAAELAASDLIALIEANAEAPEVLALAHILLAHRAIVEEGANPVALEAASAHVDQALALLGGEGGAGAN